MKKGKLFVGAMALVLAVGAAFAFKGQSLPGNLYYYNSDFTCVAAPCATNDQTGNLCQNAPLYWDADCFQEFVGTAFTTDGGGK